jgi:hypothetical protein
MAPQAPRHAVPKKQRFNFQEPNADEPQPKRSLTEWNSHGIFHPFFVRVHFRELKIFAFFAKISLSRDYSDLQSSCKSELLQSSLKPSARLGAFRRKSAGKSFPPNFAEVAECRRKKQKTFPGLRHWRLWRHGGRQGRQDFFLTLVV